MMEEQFFDDLREKIKSYFEHSKGHGWDHTERVYRLSLKISKKTDADLDVVKAAALLHDVAREKEEVDETICHAEEGAKIAREILNELKFPSEKIEKVCYAISVHRFSKGKQAETIEAKILQDADRLEVLGATIITRVFMKTGAKGHILYDPTIKPEEKYTGKPTTAINHFYEKALKIKPETFNTEKAKKIAKKRYAFVEKFLKQFKLEWEGKA